MIIFKTKKIMFLLKPKTPNISEIRNLNWCSRINFSWIVFKMRKIFMICFKIGSSKLSFLVVILKKEKLRILKKR